MRRTMLAALGILALCLAVPGAALAHKGHHKGHHHAKTHAKRKARHASVRFVHFGASTAPTTPGTGSGAPSGTGSGPTTPTPTTTTPENAGTVVSYEKGLLKLELSNKSTVEGNVTGNTEIECIRESATPPPAPTSSPSDQSPGDDNGQGDDQSSGDQNQQPSDQQSSGSDEQQGDGQDQSDDDGQPQSAPEPVCDTTDLTAGTVVRSAELRIGPSGSEFESLVLVLK